MAARRRVAGRRNWPDNLYMNNQGYYWFRNPKTGATFGLGSDFKAAVSQAKAANAQIFAMSGEVSLVRRMMEPEKSFAEWCDDYEALFLERIGSETRLFKAERSYVRRAKASEFAIKALPDVTPKDIAEYIKKTTLDSGVPTAARMQKRLADMFRSAIGEGLIKPGSSPVDSIKAPTVKVKRARLTLDNYLALTAAAREAGAQPWEVNAIELALVTAQRRDDIVSWTFADIKDGFLWVRQAKTDTRIKIPLSLRLKAVGITVEDVVKRCRDRVVSSHLIHISRPHASSVPGQPPNSHSLSRSFARYRDRAGIQVEEGRTPPSFHEIRSLAARLYTAEYGKDFAQALLGHKSSTMTDIYRDVRGAEWSEVSIPAVG